MTINDNGQWQWQWAVTVAVAMVAYHLEAKQARDKLAENAKKHDIQDSEGIRTCVRRSHGTLTGLDEAWQLELSMLDLINGPQSETFATTRILKIMPTATRRIELPTAIASMERLLTMDCTKMAPVGIQSASKAILGHLRTLHASTFSASSSKQSKFVRSILVAFEWFLVHGSPELHGAKAMEKLLEDAELQFEQKKSVCDEYIAKLQRFRWLVPTAKLVKVKAMETASSKGARGKGGAVAKSAAASSSSGPSMVALDMFS